MTQRELFEKIQRGDVLDAREALFLEQVLDSQHDGPVAQVLMNEPDPELSLAWRSGLNEQLKAMAPQPVKRARRLNWFLPGLAAGAAACVMALVVFVNPMGAETTVSPVASESVDSSLDGTDSYRTEASTMRPMVPRRPRSMEGALIQAHLVDEVEVSGGVYSPRSVADSGFDWSSL